jgi:hypothetical protein
MPLPPALAARLAKRGILQTADTNSGKPGGKTDGEIFRIYDRRRVYTIFIISRK